MAFSSRVVGYFVSSGKCFVNLFSMQIRASMEAKPKECYTRSRKHWGSQDHLGDNEYCNSFVEENAHGTKPVSVRGEISQLTSRIRKSNQILPLSLHGSFLRKRPNSSRELLNRLRRNERVLKERMLVERRTDGAGIRSDAKRRPTNEWPDNSHEVHIGPWDSSDAALYDMRRGSPVTSRSLHNEVDGAQSHTLARPSTDDVDRIRSAVKLSVAAMVDSVVKNCAYGSSVGMESRGKGLYSRFVNNEDRSIEFSFGCVPCILFASDPRAQVEIIENQPSKPNPA